MTDPTTTPPPAPLARAGRALNARPAVHDVSHPRGTLAPRSAAPALAAVSCLVRGPKLDDPHATARGRRIPDRLMAGVFA